jgi:hypothetical protein
MSFRRTGWQGIDTVIVSAGVSALRPILSVAGVEAHKAAKFTPHATEDGIRRLVQVSAAATTGNYVGPLVAAATFVRIHVPILFFLPPL